MKRWQIGLLIALPVVLIAFFIGVWQFLSPDDRITTVAYSEFLAEVHAGKVVEIRIRDREYRYRTDAKGPDGHLVVKAAIGPVPDQALVDSLKPDDKDKAPPKIVFDR
jgi:hypothetical protein